MWIIVWRVVDVGKEKQEHLMHFSSLTRPLGWFFRNDSRGFWGNNMETKMIQNGIKHSHHHFLRRWLEV